MHHTTWIQLNVARQTNSEYEGSKNLYGIHKFRRMFGIRVDRITKYCQNKYLLVVGRIGALPILRFSFLTKLFSLFT